MGQPWDTTTTALRIGDLSVNLRQRRVEIDGCIAELPPRVFDLFLLFLAEPGVVHSRESLFRRIWPGLVVEDGSLSQGIWLLRRALGEERKHCLRTVSRLGYVFEPWTRIVPETDPDETDPDESVAADVAAPSLVALESASSSSISPSVSRSKTGFLFGRRRITLAAALLAVAAIASVLWAVRPWSDAAADAPPATVPVASVGVVLLAPTVSDPDALKAGVLLRDWVRFRLWGLPEVLVLSEEDLGDDASYAPDHVILLTTGRVAGEAGQVFLRATFGASGAQGGEHRIERRGTPGQLPKMIEAVAAEVVTRIAPQRRSAPAPSYAIGDGAADYAEGLRKIEARDWPGAMVALQAAMRSAPRAGIVRLRLAEVLVEQGESRLASEQLVAARSMFGPLPVDTEVLIELQRDRSLATADADFLRIAARYDALAKRHPERVDYALDAIMLQVSAGRLEDALRSLSQPGWDRQPFRIRINAGLLRCYAQINLGYFDAAERCAQQQMRLIGAAGAAQLWYRGKAESLLALARQNRNPDRVDPALFERAAKTFDSGGYAMDALRERVRAKLIGVTPSAGTMPELEQVLADVRRNGLRDLEVVLLRDLARRSLALGRNADYRRLLTDAERVAAIAGNETHLIKISLELLVDDYRLGAMDEVERRIAVLQRMRLAGEDAMVLAVMSANLRLEQGRPRESRTALLRGTVAVTDDGRSPLSPLAAGMLGYSRAHVAMHQGQLDEAAQALAAARRGMPEYYSMILDFSDASLAIMRGDIELTKSRIERGLGALQGVDDAQTQRQAKLNAAFLLTRVGEGKRAARMYEDLLPGLTAAGDVYLRIQALIGLAETAAAQGDWSASRRHADAAAATAVGQQWMLSSRLSLLRLAEALDRGDHAQARERFAQLDAGALRADDHLVRSALALLRERVPDAELPPVTRRPKTPALYRSEAAWLAEAVRPGGIAAGSGDSP